jgi:hypothetical protein
MPFMAFFCRPEKHSLIYMAALALMGAAEGLRLVGMGGLGITSFKACRSFLSWCRDDQTVLAK